MERRNFLAWVGSVSGLAFGGVSGCSGAAESGEPAGDSAGTEAGAEAGVEAGGPDAFAADAGTVPPDAGAADAAADAAACTPTRADALGPFYEAGAPSRTVIAGPDEPGERVIMRGRVLGADCTTPVPNAIVDVWHADSNGEYHASSENWRLRGQMKTDAQGRYEFETILPGYYSGRPRHYHYMVTSPGFVPLVTQLYFAGDPFLGPNDSCQQPTCDSDDPERIIELAAGPTAGSPRTGWFEVKLAAA